MGKLRRKLRADLEAPEAERAFGTGWFSGVLALALALMCLGAVVFLMFPACSACRCCGSTTASAGSVSSCIWR
jgi:hypothetical protein